VRRSSSFLAPTDLFTSVEEEGEYEEELPVEEE
jgi:hypothetical protein